MNVEWENRSVISASLLNPAFCGEVIRRVAISYNKSGDSQFPYVLSFIILHLLLHKKTRDVFPGNSSALFHLWVKENEALLMNFASRVRDMNEYTKEALMFLLKNNSISISDSGHVLVNYYRRKSPQGSDIEEVTDIFRKADRLGLWLRNTGATQTIFMFLKIRP
jgi:hypothetical protein